MISLVLAVILTHLERRNPMPRCDLSDLPEEMCGCRIHATPDPAADDVQGRDQAGRPFVARYEGWCGACRDRIVPGEEVVRNTETDTYEHTDCWQRG